ncbi:MAG: hypothetical protein ACREQW_17595 [Candidatus Binatia bacterium]
MKPYACLILNLRTEHSKVAPDKTACDFRRLIDRAILDGESYYLIYLPSLGHAPAS